MNFYFILFFLVVAVVILSLAFVLSFYFFIRKLALKLDFSLPHNPQSPLYFKYFFPPNFIVFYFWKKNFFPRNWFNVEITPTAHRVWCCDGALQCGGNYQTFWLRRQFVFIKLSALCTLLYCSFNSTMSVELVFVGLLANYFLPFLWLFCRIFSCFWALFYSLFFGFLEFK